MTLLVIFIDLNLVIQIKLFQKLIIIKLEDLMNYQSQDQIKQFSPMLYLSNDSRKFNLSQTTSLISTGAFIGVDSFEFPQKRNLMQSFLNVPIPIMNKNQQFDTLSWSQDNVLAFGYYDLIFFYKIDDNPFNYQHTSNLGLCTRRAPSPIKLLRFFDNDKVCLTSKGGNLYLYDVVQQKNLLTISSGYFTDITAIENMNQNCLLYGGKSGWAAIYDFRMRAPAKTWQISQHLQLKRIRYNPQSQKILTQSEGGVISVAQIKGKGPVKKYSYPNFSQLTGLDWIIGKNCFATSSRYSEQLCIYSQSGSRLVKKVTNGITSMTYSETMNSLLLTFQHNKQTRIISTRNLDEIGNAQEMGYIKHSQHSPFKMLLNKTESLLACPSSGNLRFYRTPNSFHQIKQ